MARNAIPVTLLTGFLGSGKTSLLKRLIHQPAFARCAVVINEFGDVGLDQALVADQSDDQDIQLLDSGCLCCLASSSIQETLASLYYRRLRKEIPWFDRILIETSGLAEPGPIINAIHGDNTLNRHVRLDRIVTTFDAGFGQKDVDQYREAKLQLMMADTIVVTKGDLHPQADAVLASLQDTHPSASIITNQLEDAALARAILNSATRRSADSSVSPAGTLAAGSPPPGALGASSFTMPSALRHVLAYGIYSITARIDQPVSWKAWAEFVRHVQQGFGEQLLRFKGILDFEAPDQPMAVHAVHHLFSPPEPLGRQAGPVGTLVFIVQGLEREPIEAAVNILRGGQCG